MRKTHSRYLTVHVKYLLNQSIKLSSQYSLGYTNMIKAMPIYNALTLLYLSTALSTGIFSFVAFDEFDYYDLNHSSMKAWINYKHIRTRTQGRMLWIINWKEKIAVVEGL